MARIRTLKPSFWEDPTVCRLSRDTRLTAIAIISYADDRGRLDFSAAALRGYAFRHDNVTDKRVHSWMLQVVERGIASAYEVSGFAYLWLPKFWRHQVINRPTESQLPPHPEDPYGHLEIKKALAQFRDDSESDSRSESVSGSLNSHGGLTPSRAGGRSLPICSSSVVDVLNSNDNGDSKPDRTPSKHVDQDVLPASLPEQLRSTAREVHAVIAAVYGERGGDMPTLRGVGLAMDAFHDRDHLAVAHDLQHWATAGKGRNQSVVDWARTYRTFLRKATPGKPMRSGESGGGQGASRFAEYDRAAGL